MATTDIYGEVAKAINTEKAGGTRFSAGKPLRNWAPLRSLDRIWKMADFSKTSSLWTPYQPDEAVLDSIEDNIRGALDDPYAVDEDGKFLVENASYMTMVLLHEMHGGHEDDRRPFRGIDAVCAVSVQGADKYAPFDYRHGQSFSTLLSCAHRHSCKALNDRWARDEESGNLHLGHVGWNLNCLLEFMDEHRHDLDDITPWHGINTAQKRAALKIVTDTGRSVLDVLRSYHAGTVRLDV